MAKILRLSIALSCVCLVFVGATRAADDIQKENQSAVAQVESGKGLAQSVGVNVHLQANAGQHEMWPGSTATWHYGTGYIEPFGPASYYCGEGFPEQKQHPLPDWAKGMMKALTGKADGLFCVYVANDGMFFVYDSVVGSRRVYREGLQNDTINLVIDGTGAFKGATGFWHGLTEGRGVVTQVTPGRRTPEVILKIMQGYVRLAEAQP